MGIGGWQFAAGMTDTGATLAVKAHARDAVMLAVLGFIGAMMRGIHNQPHHLMIAQGDNPHHILQVQHTATKQT